jgi:hypothetical protein
MAASIDVVSGDVLNTACDVLVLKYAQGFYGADLAVADALDLRSERFRLSPGEHLLLPTAGKLPCKNVLFYGVCKLWDFGYSEIRGFAIQAMKALASTGAERDVVAMAVHGVGYGLDEREAFTAQLAGLMEYLTSGSFPGSPRRIMIVARDPNRVQRLKALMQRVLLESGFGQPRSASIGAQTQLPDAGVRSDLKKHVFVAMPYNDEMEDVYDFGIREPVNETGCLCERCDRDIFTGDILERIKDRIATANVVIADMTGSNPNVYLEVGYAWGKCIPTLLIAREGEELKFDVKTQKCIYYKNITQLRKQLVQCMLRLLAETEPS